jgi:hypothetical protein
LGRTAETERRGGQAVHTGLSDGPP